MFLKKIENLTHLRCFLHERQNIDRHLNTVGISEFNRNIILADIFGRQAGSMFQEGLIDSDNAKEFWLRMAEVIKKMKRANGHQRRKRPFVNLM